MYLPVKNTEVRAPYQRIVNALASAGIFGTNYDLEKSAELRRFELAVQQKDEVRAEMYQFYKDVEKQNQQMIQTMQTMKRDYYRELDHLREQLSKKKRDPKFDPDNVFFFDIGTYGLPSWEQVVDKLDGDRMKRELVLTEMGGSENVKKVPVHMLCEKCQNKFGGPEDISRDQSVQTDSKSMNKVSDEHVQTVGWKLFSPTDHLSDVSTTAYADLDGASIVEDKDEEDQSDAEAWPSLCANSEGRVDTGDAIDPASDRTLKSGEASQWQPQPGECNEISTQTEDENSGSRTGRGKHRSGKDSEGQTEDSDGSCSETGSDEESISRNRRQTSVAERSQRLHDALDRVRKRLAFASLLTNWSERQKRSIEKHHRRMSLTRSGSPEPDLHTTSLSQSGNSWSFASSDSPERRWSKPAAEATSDMATGTASDATVNSSASASINIFRPWSSEIDSSMQIDGIITKRLLKTPTQDSLVAGLECQLRQRPASSGGEMSTKSDGAGPPESADPFCISGKGIMKFELTAPSQSGKKLQPIKAFHESLSSKRANSRGQAIGYDLFAQDLRLGRKSNLSLSGSASLGALTLPILDKRPGSSLTLGSYGDSNLPAVRQLPRNAGFNTGDRK
jgi:uncharacterized protein YprB with RNaseH-like and TPR domain